MDCNETRRLLDAEVDDELDLVRHLEFAEHLRTCRDCARLAANARACRTALRESLPRFTASPQLHDKIRATPPPASVPTAKRANVFSWWQVTGLAASIAFATFIGFRWGSSRAYTSRLVDEAVSDHVRSLQANHLTDVASTDQHTVKPWFAGKLDFSPPVVDLAAAGFPLIGGRLEHLDGRPAAALVFRRRQHTINLFVWPAGGREPSSYRDTRNGYHTELWSEAGLDFLAVSEIPASELTQFVEIFRKRSR